MCVTDSTLQWQKTHYPVQQLVYVSLLHTANLVVMHTAANCTQALPNNWPFFYYYLNMCCRREVSPQGDRTSGETCCCWVFQTLFLWCFEDHKPNFSQLHIFEWYLNISKLFGWIDSKDLCFLGGLCRWTDPWKSTRRSNYFWSASVTL